jgi:hypothetical protein
VGVAASLMGANAGFFSDINDFQQTIENAST